MNSGRTHPNSDIAFPQSTAYACAVTQHLTGMTRLVRWLSSIFRSA